MSSRNRTLHMFSFEERNSGKWMYRAHGRIAECEILQITPEEDSAGAYCLWYIPQLVPLTLTTSLDNIQQKFAAYMEIYAAIAILTKAKRDTNVLEGKLERLTRRIKTMANNRDSEAEQGGTSDDRYGDGGGAGDFWGSR